MHVLSQIFFCFGFLLGKEVTQCSQDIMFTWLSFVHPEVHYCFPQNCIGICHHSQSKFLNCLLIWYWDYFLLKKPLDSLSNSHEIWNTFSLIRRHHSIWNKYKSKKIWGFYEFTFSLLTRKSPYCCESTWTVTSNVNPRNVDMSRCTCQVKAFKHGGGHATTAGNWK